MLPLGAGTIRPTHVLDDDHQKEAALDWLTTPLPDLAPIVASAVLIIVWLLLSVRVTGLRTFSKMASIDFAVTVASGTIVASTIISSVTVADGAIALAALLVIQAGFAKLRRNASAAQVLENAPLLLMAGPELLDDNLRRSRVSADDVRAKLREANVLRLDDVRAVVLETTGDISVLHGDAELEPALLDGVRDADRVVDGT